VKAEPSRDTDHPQKPWTSFTGTVLVTIISAATVLGAVLLATQGQAQRGQATVQQSESSEVDLIPTSAVATPPPITLIPTILTANPTERADEANATSMTEPSREPNERSGGQDTNLSPTSAITTTPTLLKTVAPAPTATPWPCAGSRPVHWKLYRVQPGDTLFSLALSHNTTMYWVISYNCLTSDQIQVGQGLYLPPAPTATPVPSLMPTADSLTPPSPTVVLTTTTPPPLATATVTITASPSVLPTSTPNLTLTPGSTATASPTPTSFSTPTTEPAATPTTPPTSTPYEEPTFTPVLTETLTLHSIP
jgi:LysM repeat protein